MNGNSISQSLLFKSLPSRTMCQSLLYDFVPMHTVRLFAKNSIVWNQGFL